MLGDLSLDPLRTALKDRYLLGDELGRGAMSVVYAAHDLRYRRDVAVKVLRSDVGSVIGTDRFLREIGIVARLQHPHILPLLDSGEAGGLLYYVMPSVEGGSLRDHLDGSRQLPIPEAVRIAREVASALACAHEHGVIHRDIKPANILLSSGVAIVADFGIARALADVGYEDLRTGGMVIGTPGYMSPEQSVGDRIDGRSDIFSLGCVLYEMLAGERPFTGPTPQAITARVVHAPVPPLRVVRGSIPPALEHIIERALAKHAADRFPTAAELVRALEGVQAGSAPREAEAAALRRRRVIAGGLAAVGAVGLVAALSMDAVRDRLGRLGGSVADTTRLAVFPLDQDERSEARTIHDHLLHTALSRWRGISLVEHYQVADVLRRNGPVTSDDDASTRAVALGAGRYVRGRTVIVGDSVDATVAVFDIGNPVPLERVTERLPLAPAAAAAGYDRLARKLLLRGGDADLAANEAVGERSLPALQAFGRAQRALDEWDLAAADSALQAAVQFDPNDARANLWLAQVRVWRVSPVTSWAIVAERAAAAAPALSERERRLAEALVFIAHRQYASACSVYDTLRQRNDRDFAAWFGLGECRRLDRFVVPMPSSPSGWGYRSSYHAAMEAYTTAFEVLPSVHRGFERGAFERLRVLLLLSTSLVQGLGVVGSDTTMFYARPALQGDTLALIPYPWQVISAGGAAAIPPGFEAALERQRMRFRQIADRWSAAFPRSSGAKEAVAMALELQGDRAAIDTIRLARRLATDSARALRLAGAEALLLLKFGTPDHPGDLRAARALADSVLSNDANDGVEPELLWSLAALLGRCDRAEELARRTRHSSTMGIPPRIVTEADALIARASLGCPTTPPAANMAALVSMIDREYRAAAQAERARVDEMLLFRPALLAQELDSAVIARMASNGSHPLLRAAGALVRHDTVGARTALTGFEAESRAGSVTMTADFAYPGARLWAAIGDTAAAIAMLDQSLSDAPSYDPSTLSEDGAVVGSFVRAVILRSRLASARRDVPQAERWGTAARILWGDADPELNEMVRRTGSPRGRR